LHRVLERAAYAPVDQALVTEMVLGTLRQQGRLDYALESALRRPLLSLPPAIRTILRLGLYQVWFLDRVPDAAAVHQAVEAAKRHGHAGTARLVNAVLRRLAAEGEPPPPRPEDDPVGHLAVTHSHPRWLVQRWIARWGARETRALCAANNLPPPSTLRVNLLRATTEAVASRLRQRGLQVAPGGLPEALRVRGTLALRLDLYREGLVTMQDEGAMAVAHLLAPQPGETVLDATAGSGIKATHLAELMRNQGRLIALDIQPAKLKALSAHCARLGIDIVEAHHLDAHQAGARFRGQMDRVLVDAPCTGLGVLGRRPEIRWRVSPEDIPAMAAKQRALLAAVAGAVRPGGVLVYAVCSLEPEEGQEVVDDFLRRRPAFVLEESRLLLPHRHGTDGFYMARLRRRAEGRREGGPRGEG
jgi:16S rRNA (cytosine967-C5)-methyltransferase